MGKDGHLNKQGTDLLVILLSKINPYFWGDAFIPLKKMGIHCAVEVILRNKGRVLLTERNDGFFKGLHFPGGFMVQGETLEVAAKRIARQELGIKIKFVKEIGFFNNTENKRFQEVSLLALCETSENPKMGRWFSTCPKNIIPLHKKFWKKIKPFLR